MPPEPTVVDMEKLAQEEQMRKASPAPFHSALENVKGPSADEEAKMREMFGKVTLDNLDDQVQVQAPPSVGQPKTPEPAPPASTPDQAPPAQQVPAKFLKPDGTVDEEKLKTSSQALSQAIDKKQKTVDEMLVEYRENEKKFTELGQKAKQLTDNPPPPAPKTQNVPDVINQNLPPEQIRQQLLALQQSDPIAFAVEIARAVSQKEARDIAAPALELTDKLTARERDQQMRDNLVSLVERDPRLQDTQFYSEFINELNSDPGYFKLRNPQKAAWNAVKERLHLGDPQGLAQPSATAPTLGRGTTPPVSSLPQVMTPQRATDEIRSVNPFSEEGKKLEEALLRQMAESTWRG